MIRSTIYGLQFCDLHQIVGFAGFLFLCPVVVVVVVVVIFGPRLHALPYSMSVVKCGRVCVCVFLIRFPKRYFALYLLMKCATPITFPLIWFKVHWKLNHSLQDWVENIGWPGVQRLIYMYKCNVKDGINNNGITLELYVQAACVSMCTHSFNILRTCYKSWKPKIELEHTHTHTHTNVNSCQSEHEIR